MKKSVWFLWFVCFAVFTLILPDFNEEKASVTVSAEDTVYSYSDYSVVTSIENGYDLSYVNNTLLVSNVLTKKILDYTGGTEYSLNYQPTAIANDYHDRTYFARSGLYGLCSIRTVGAENPAVTLYSDYYDENNTESIGIVYDLACDIYGTVYAIANNSGNNAVIIYKQKDESSFYLYKELDGLTLNAGTRIQTSLDNNFLLFYNDGNIYKTDFETAGFEAVTDGSSPEDAVYTLPADFGQITDIKVDFHDTLFVLATKDEVSTLYRCDKNAEDYTSVSSSAFANSIGIALDFTDGYIYSLTGYNIVKFRITGNETNFINVVQTDNDPDYENTLLDVELLITTADNVPLYEYDNALYIKELNGTQITFAKDTKLFALNDCENGYFFVLVTNLTDENITGYVKLSSVAILEESQVYGTGRITVPNTEIFSYPTSLGNLQRTENGENLIFSKDVYFNIINYDFGERDYNGIFFTKIMLADHSFAYIDSNSFVPVTQTTLKPTVATNARTTDTVTVYEDETCTTELTQLETGTDIEILEQSNGIAKITWGLGTAVGYISTQNLTTDQISEMQLTGLILMSVSLIAAIVLICFISAKKETTPTEKEAETPNESKTETKENLT